MVYVAAGVSGDFCLKQVAPPFYEIANSYVPSQIKDSARTLRSAFRLVSLQAQTNRG